MKECRNSNRQQSPPTTDEVPLIFASRLIAEVNEFFKNTGHTG